MKKVEVLLTPSLSEYVDFQAKTVVIIDVFRATSTILSAFKKGVKQVSTTGDVDLALEFKNTSNYCIAGERNGKKIAGFDLGNSPVEVESKLGVDQTLVLTSTNGTRCIELAYKSQANDILIASFANINAVVTCLLQQENDVVIFCAGWKGRVNLEDSLCAGAILEGLNFKYCLDDDACYMVLSLWNSCSADPFSYLSRASHFKRLKQYGNEQDLLWCCELNTMNQVPYLESWSDNIAKLSIKSVL